MAIIRVLSLVLYKLESCSAVSNMVAILEEEHRYITSWPPPSHDLFFFFFFFCVRLQMPAVTVMDVCWVVVFSCSAAMACCFVCKFASGMSKFVMSAS